MKRIAILTALLLAAVSSFGQAARVDIPLQTSGPNVPISGGPLPQALWVANAAAYLCTHPSATLAACQAAPITTYTDSTEGTTCPPATPLVQLPGNTCTAATGTTANVGFWYGGGVFDYWIVSSYGTYGPFSGNSSNSALPSSCGNPTGIPCGGTGATTAAGALANLGGAALTGAAFTGPVSAQSVASGTVILDNITGDAGAAINAAFASYNVVEVTAANPTATTTITIPNAATGLNGIAGTLRFRGTGTFTVPQILFQDSTTASVGSGFLDCPEGATILLANGSNKTLVSDTNFSTLTGGTSWYGAFQARVHGCILNGNNANNTAGWVVQLYGRALRLNSGKSFYGAQGGVWTELGHGGYGFTSPSDDYESKIRDWQSSYNTGPGMNIHSGDTILSDVVTSMNSTWGIISSYNGAMINGLNSYGNTLGGCWATTTGSFAGSALYCDTLTSGIGLLEDSTAGPMDITSGGMGGPGIVIEVMQPGNRFEGAVLASAGATGVQFAGGSGTFIGEFCVGNGGGGYVFDFTGTGGENGASTILTSQECGAGALFKGTPSWDDTIFIPVNSAVGSPYFQIGTEGTLYVGNLGGLKTTLTFPSTGEMLVPRLTVSTNPSSSGATLFNLFGTQTSLGTGSAPSEAQRIYGAPGTYNGITAAGYYVNDLYFGKDAPTDDFIVSTTNTASPTELFRVFINGNGVKTPGAYYNANGILLPSAALGNKSANNTGAAYVELVLTGTTGTITGTALTATCDSGTATVTGAVVGHPVAVSSTTGVDVGGAFNVRASVTATGVVTVYVCGTGTPASLAYNVTVL